MTNLPRWLLPALLLPVLAAAQTDDAALLRCAAQSDATARLGCFDALARQARERQAAGPVRPVAATAAAAPDAKRTAEFGKPRIDASEIDVLESRIPGRFSGWGPRQRFTLANGQVWEISDDSSSFGNAQDVAVKIRRGAIGSYFMDVDGVRRSPRVRRVE